MIYRLQTDLSIDGWHGELHVAVGDVSLAEVEAAAAKELLADGREGSITANNQVCLDLFFRSIGPETKPGAGQINFSVRCSNFHIS